MREIEVSGGNLASLLEALGEQPDEPRSTILPEAAIMRLRDAFDAYHAPNPHKPGDIVTARADCNLKRAGLPHIVMEVDDNIPINYTAEPGDFRFGEKLDTRIAVLAGSDQIVFFWVHHWQFVPYEPSR